MLALAEDENDDDAVGAVRNNLLPTKFNAREERKSMIICAGLALLCILVPGNIRFEPGDSETRSRAGANFNTTVV